MKKEDFKSISRSELQVRDKLREVEEDLLNINKKIRGKKYNSLKTIAKTLKWVLFEEELDL